ncbi:MAG: TIM44-like domain-containing protein [Myxococcales bacterium]|nr:TIM44-like domain-containing protein [Polyangiaceae bacterium]MDW8252080.1 TIM44-like domain-containing protein [Myxococcales bacterium]
MMTRNLILRAPLSGGKMGRNERRTSLPDLTALLVALALGLVTFSPCSDAYGRPGGGQTFKSSSSSSRSSSSGGSKSSSGSSYQPSSGSTYKSSSGSGSKPSSGSTYQPSSGSGSNSDSDFTGSGYSTGSGSSYQSNSAGGGHCCLLSALVLVGIGVCIYLIHEKIQSSKPDWSSNSPVYSPPSVDDHHKRTLTESFQKLLELDPTFSRVLLEDFLYALYVEVQRSRGGNHLGRMAAYLSPEVIQAYQAYPAGEVRDIIVGALTFEDVRVPGERTGQAVITVRFLANYTEVGANGEQSWYVEEVWTLTRSAGHPSRKPEQARTIGCPNCGAPLEQVFQGVCRYCNARVTGEQELDWRVQRIEMVNREARGPMLTGTVEEVGTEFPTVFDPMLNRNQTLLQARDPELSWPAFEDRVRMIFDTFHRAWSAQDLSAMRPYLSDNLFYLQVYWIEAYKKQGLRNVSESPQLLRLELCKVETDGHYDLVTVRIHAQNIDYTVNTQGQVVGGDRGKIRRYSEYWTFLRGKEAKGASRCDPTCPNCGAPLSQINMAGNCGSCGVKVTAGVFDWVLSRIEQDEVYTG